MAYEIVDTDYVLTHMNDMPVIDVRPAYMFKSGHLPHALDIQLLATFEEGGDIPEHYAEKFQDSGIKPHDDEIIYCNGGVLARKACEILDGQGYDHIHCYLGGYVDWTDDDDRPVER